MSLLSAFEVSCISEVAGALSKNSLNRQIKLSLSISLIHAVESKIKIKEST